MIAIKELHTPRVLKKMVREGRKHELNSMVEEKEDFEDAAMCNHPKVIKMKFSCQNDQNKSQLSDFNDLQGKSVK